MPLQLADKNITIADAVARLPDYPFKTLTLYDGHSPGPRRHWRQYTTDDIDAARIIERRAIRDDVAERILSAELPWDKVPSRSLDIEDVSPDSRAYDQLARFYLALTALHGVGQAIASKMMYLRWPGATPIQDGLLTKLYRTAARNKYQDLRRSGSLPEVAGDVGWTRLYMFAVRDDVISNRRSGQLDALRQKVQQDLDSERAQLLVDLPDCRLLDAVAWQFQKEAA